MHLFVVLRSHNFESAEQAAGFPGVVPVEKRSGKSVHSRPRMSKTGPPQVREKLYMSALCGKIHNKRMRTRYDELCLRGKPKMVATGTLMRKLVHGCYGAIKTGTAFCKDISNPLVHTSRSAEYHKASLQSSSIINLAARPAGAGSMPYLP